MFHRSKNETIGTFGSSCEFLQELLHSASDQTTSDSQFEANFSSIDITNELSSNRLTDLGKYNQQTCTSTHSYKNLKELKVVLTRIPSELVNDLNSNITSSYFGVGKRNCSSISKVSSLLLGQRGQK